MRRICIVGVGVVRVDRHYDKGLRELFYEAASKAMDDAGGVVPEALVVGSMLSSTLSGQDNLAALLSDYAGLGGIPAVRAEAGEASGAAAVHMGAYMVASGLFDVVMVAGVEKSTEFPSRTYTSAVSQSLDAEYESYYGATPASLAGLAMRLYMERYRVSRDSMSAWPVLMHEHASKNPHAMLRFRVTPEQVKKSPPVSDPVRLLDAHPIGDGSAAVILASEEVARKLTDTPVYVEAFSSATGEFYYAGREDLLSFEPTIRAAKTVYERLGIGPEDLDIVEVHDDYTVTGLIALEDLGIAPRGETAKLLEEGRFRAGDRPLVNPSGGLKARGHPVGATGVYQVAELTMQLRGDFPGVSAEDASTALAHSVGGFGSTCFITALRR